MYFYKKKHKNKGKSSSRRKDNTNGSKNSRQKRKERRGSISETQRLSIVNAVLNKRRLLVYTDSL